MYKTYQNFDPLAALDANAFIRQGIIPIASLNERNALTAHKGMTIVRSDLNNREERFDGSTWVAHEAGSLIVYPASVSGATIAADGTVVPNAAQSISVNGVFSTKYRHYRIDYWYKSDAANGGWIRLRGNGTDNTSAKYSYRIGVQSGTNSQLTQETQNISFFGIPGAAAEIHFGEIHVYNPAHSGANNLKTLTGNDNGIFNMSQTQYAGALLDADNSAFDGFTYSLSSPGSFLTTAPCAFKVYAYA